MLADLVLYDASMEPRIVGKLAVTRRTNLKDALTKAAGAKFKRFNLSTDFIVKRHKTDLFPSAVNKDGDVITIA